MACSTRRCNQTAHAIQQQPVQPQPGDPMLADVVNPAGRRFEDWQRKVKRLPSLWTPFRPVQRLPRLGLLALARASRPRKSPRNARDWPDPRCATKGKLRNRKSCPTSAQPAITSKGLARAFGPDLVGMPVDAAQEALNLLIAGGGFVGHKLGLLKQPPDLLHGSPGPRTGGLTKLTSRTMGRQHGWPANSAGRCTGEAASPAATEALKKGMANLQSACGGESGAGQRGAIRVSGDPELFASHATTAENLKAALGKGRSLELYSPSIGITRGWILQISGI